jgi:flagellar basal-body rod protein FlgC
VVTTSAAGSPVSDLFERLLQAKRALKLDPDKTSVRHLDEADLVRLEEGRQGISFEVATDNGTPTRFEYDPGHPDANEDGYVEYPNVEVIKEMVDLMAAARAYEANVTVMNSTKAMLRKALEI